MTDAAGEPLPYLDSLSFRVIDDAETSVEALQASDLDLVITPNGRAISTIQDHGDDYSIALIEHHVNTNFLLVDLDKPGPLQDQTVVGPLVVLPPPAEPPTVDANTALTERRAPA